MRTLIVVAVSLAGAPADAALAESGRLVAVYDAILRADFDRASSELARACPPAPEPACKALAASALWWRIQLDPDSRALDAALERATAEATAASGSWTTREPQRGEAWFYLAGSYGPLVQWRVYRGERLAAAREGNRIRAALERALALDPGLQDAYFGIGLYHYYADVAPLGAKLLRILLLLPGGDRERGLREMLQAREHGVLLAGEADYQLHWIYLWYEHRPDRAIELLRGLDARYPTNPLFLQRIAEIERDARQDHAASADAWQQLIDRATGGRVADTAATLVRARLGLAAELIELQAVERAIQHLDAVIAQHPTRPYEAEALAQLELGIAYGRAGHRDRAMAALSRAIAIAPRDDPANVRSRARDAMTHVK